MEVGVISDIHANLPALKAVLDELDSQGVDEIVCLGDLIGVLGWPDKVVATVREHATHTVYGNHDSRLFSDRHWMPQRDVEIAEHETATENLSEENLNWLESLPASKTVYDDVLLTHSRPDVNDPSGSTKGDSGLHPRDFITVGSNYADGGVILVGHTHHQHAVNLSKFDGCEGLVLNPGSVGFPFEGEASFAVVDVESQEYELSQVEYDNTPVLARLEEQGITNPHGPGNQRRRRRDRR